MSMTESNPPHSEPDQNPSSDQIEDDPIWQNEEEGDKEEDTEDDRSGKGEGGGRTPVQKSRLDIRLQDLLDEKEFQEGSFLDKLRMLCWAPFSLVIEGATAFAAENDLSRRMMLGRIGLANKELHPSDLADPQLIEKRHHLALNRLESFRDRDIRSSGLNLGSLSAFMSMAAEKLKGSQKDKPKKDKKKKRGSILGKIFDDKMGSSKLGGMSSEEEKPIARPQASVPPPSSGGFDKK